MGELVFVGTSDAFGAGGRAHTAALVRAHGGALLVDCGPTTLQGLERLRIDRGEVDAVVLTHFHGDHFAGVPFLLLACLYEDERERPLVIAGPPGVEQRVRCLADALGYGLEGREWTFDIVFRELRAGTPVEVGPFELESFEVQHQKEVHPHGLHLRVDGRHLVFSGDTGWFDGLIDEVRGADLFVCECTFYDRGYDFHIDYVQLLEHRDRLECGRLVITHLGREMRVREDTAEFERADDGTAIPF